MASVTGITAERAQEIADNSVVGGQVIANDIVLIKGSTESVTIGRVAAFHSWPVGSIFFNVTATSPATLLGGGTWTRFAQGQMLVGVNEADPLLLFNTTLKSGGNPSTTLGVINLPSHSHGGVTGLESSNHSHSGTTTLEGFHQHGYVMPVSTSNKAFGSSGDIGSSGGTLTDGAGTHQHSFTTAGVSANHNHPISAEGGGQSFSNMSPYITVYIWRRTA